MTTVAYKNDMIASDSQVTRGDTIVSRGSQKIFKVNYRIIMLHSGTRETIDTLMKLIEVGIEEVIRYKFKQSYFQVVFIDIVSHKFALLTNGSPCASWEPLRDEITIGTGAEHALAAMRCGLNAAEAVHAATSLDVWSGGPIMYTALSPFELIEYNPPKLTR